MTNIAIALGLAYATIGVQIALGYAECQRVSPPKFLAIVALWPLTLRS